MDQKFNAIDKKFDEIKSLLKKKRPTPEADTGEKKSHDVEKKGSKYSFNLLYLGINIHEFIISFNMKFHE